MPQQKHLIINADCDNNLMFNSIPAIYELMKDIVKIFDFANLTLPYIIKGVENKPGLSGFIIVENSYVSIHSYKEDRKVFLDIFSCKNFEHERVLEFLKQKFYSNEFKFEIIER